MATKKLYVTFQRPHKFQIRDKPCFDVLVIQLLEEIENTGSLYEACKRVGTAYRNGWNKINRFEELVGKEVIIRDGARGSSLTKFGANLIHDYNVFLEEVYQSEFFRRYRNIIQK